MHVEIEIVIPETGAREKHPCWETGVPHVYQTIIGEQIINVHVDRENVCEMPLAATTDSWPASTERQSQEPPDSPE